MSSTASSAERGSPANGAARRTSSASSSTVDVIQRHHRHDLLGEHVERIAGVVHRLDGTVAHPLGDHGALDEVAAVLREDDTS